MQSLNPGQNVGMGESRKIAFVDESVSMSSRAYMLGAVVITDTQVDAARSAMATFNKSARTKIHWYEEPERRRKRLLNGIGQLPFDGLLVARFSRSSERPERQRRKCLEVLLQELERRNVEKVVLESRGKADNARDRKMVAYLRANRTLSSELFVAHVPGPEDPMLWIADLLCGAYGAAMLGNSEYLDRFQETHELTLIEFCDDQEGGTDGAR